MRHKKIIQTTLFFSFIFCFSITQADIETNTQSLNILLDPDYPSANQSVTASIEIYSTDANRDMISWYLDGVLKDKGIGIKEFSFRTKDFSESSVVSVLIQSDNNGQFSKEIKIVPVDIDLIWEAENSSSPFYKAKSLNSHQNIIEVTALSNFVKEDGSKINAENLIYTWKQDWKVVGDSSGYGRNTFSFVGPGLYRENVITVIAETTDGLLKSKQNILINSYAPEIIFYKNDPLLGILDNKNLKYFPLEDNHSEEIKIKAYPFFFPDYNSDTLQYDWLVDGKSSIGLKNNIILRREEGTQGTFKITLEMQDLKDFVRSATESFNLIFQ